MSGFIGMMAVLEQLPIMIGNVEMKIAKIITKNKQSIRY